MDKITESTANEFVADEFVVATPHRDLVLQSLTGTQVTVGPQSPELGLSMIRFADVGHAARVVRQARERAGSPASPLPTGATARLPLEEIMVDLRAIFAHRYDGWIATIGKNRIMRGIQLFPYPDFGGGGMPTAVSGKTRPDDLVKDQTVGDRARVLILDTQVDPHPYLTGRYIANAGSLLDPTDGPREWWTGHATFIAGLVVQRAPAVQLEIESVLTDAGATPSAWDLAISMVRCANRDVDVFNLSFGCFTLDGEPPLVLQRAVQRLTANTVVVAAAGNYGAEKPTGNLPPTPKTAIWPAAFEDVVAVGASRYGGERAEFSPDVPWVDLMAPGHEVESTYLTGDVALRDKTRAPFTGMATWSGTSFAAAAVSGAIAARTVRGERTAQEALADLRAGNGGESSSGIEVARLTG